MTAAASIRCYSCGGTTQPGLVSDLYADHGVYVAVENVPADVCRQCGEHYYGPEVTRRLTELTARARRAGIAGSKAQVLVYDFGNLVPVAAG